MGFRVVFQKRALNDLARLIRWIAIDDSAAAIRFGDALVSEAELLCSLPRRGAVYDNNRGLYSFPFPPYRIYYRVVESKETVEILKIWHGARIGPPQL